MKALIRRGGAPLGTILLWGGLAALVGLALADHSGPAPDAARRPQVRAEAARPVPADGVILSPAEQELAGLAAAILPQRRFREQVTGFGTVLDLRGLTDLVGRMGVAKADLAGAQAGQAAADAAYRRSYSLYQDHFNVSAAQLQMARATLAADKAKTAMIRARLDALATTAIQSWGPILGRAAAAGSPLLSGLLSGRTVLVQVSLPAGRTLGDGQDKVTATRPGGGQVPLTLVSPAARTDSRIQGETYLFAAPADSGLQPGLDVTAGLSSGRTAMGSPVPATAVVWWRGRAWIYVKTGLRRFVRHPLATDVPLPGGGYMATGLDPKAAVVVKGAQILLSDEVLAKAPSGAAVAEDGGVGD
jgi:hypothetical protein